MRIHGHIAEALSRPALLRGAHDRYLLRFESMKVAFERSTTICFLPDSISSTMRSLNSGAV